LGEVGVRGLAKLGAIDVARQLLAKLDVKLDDAGNFYLIWLKGHGQFAQAEQSKSDEDYLAAEETLKQALAHSTARSEVAGAGQCRSTLAWCLYRRGSLEQAAEQFQQAATALKADGGDSALHAAWMAFVSLYTLAQKERRFVSSAIEVGEGIRRDHPDSKQAKDAEYIITTLKRMAGTPEETIAALSKIGPSEPNYLSARFDLGRVYHEQWLATRGTEKAAGWLSQLERAADTYLRAARSDTNEERKLKCLLWVADTAINGATFDAAKAGDLLGKAAAHAAALPVSASAVQEYHYRLLQLAQKQKDDQRVREEADWLAGNAAGSIYEQAALVVLARDIEQSLSSATAEARKPLLEKAVEIYGRFARSVGESPKAIAEIKNARVVNARLAQYDYELGNYSAAAERAERLLAALPDERDFLRLAGLAQYYNGDHGAALEKWRLLVQGLPKDKQNLDKWLEAKYYQIASLARIDRPAAIQVYQQFALLYPKLESEPWQTDREGVRRLSTN
jgi:tetratricopeptide (TPR) repeat protein